MNIRVYQRHPRLIKKSLEFIQNKKPVRGHTGRSFYSTEAQFVGKPGFTEREKTAANGADLAKIHTDTRGRFTPE